MRRFAALRRRTHLLARLHSPGLSLGHAQIEVAPGTAGLLVRVRHRLRQIGPVESGRLVLDLRSCPFMLEGIRCVPDRPAYQTLAALVFELGDLAVQDVEIEYRFVWEPRDAAGRARLLRFPDDLPRPFSLRDAARLSDPVQAPTYEIIRDELAPELTIGGVAPAAPIDGSMPTRSLLRGFALLSADTRAPLGTGAIRVIPTASLLRACGDVNAERLMSCALDAASVLTSLFGDANGMTMLLGTAEDRGAYEPTFSGPAILLDSTFMKRYPAGSFGARVEILSEMVSLYWGSACRLAGPFALEITSGIGAGTALWWAKGVADTADWEALRRAYARMTSTPRLRDLVSTLNGRLSSRATGRACFAFYDLLQREDFRATLREVTRDCWGLVVPARAVRRELRLVSV